MTYECLNLGILNKYTPISIKVALGFGHWNAEDNAMLCLSDHQTTAFKDQSTIPTATFIEISVYFFSLVNSPFKLVDTSIKSHVKENCNGAIMFQCVNVRARENSLGKVSLSNG